MVVDFRLFVLVVDSVLLMILLIFVCFCWLSILGVSISRKQRVVHPPEPKGASLAIKWECI
ncbi:unnamed protein product [Camellia sinensis]